MSNLTKEELRTALINHGVTDLPPQSAKKEHFVALYDEHVAPAANGSAEFSSDDEVYLQSSPSKRTSKASKVSNTSKVSKSSAKSPKSKASESSLNGNDIDIGALDDDELFEKLKENGIAPGPIVASTRPFYEKKLALALRGESMNQTNGSNGSNGAEYSDTDPEDDAEEEQPAVETRTTRRSASSKKASQSSASLSPSPKKSSPTKFSISSSSILINNSGLRQRPVHDELDTGKLTPTPRRSIHSYKVTETSKQVITRNRDGTETKDVYRTVERTEDGKKIGGQGNGWSQKLVTLIKVVLLLGILAALAVAFFYNRDNTITVEQIEDSVKKVVEDNAGPKEDVVQGSLGDV